MEGNFRRRGLSQYFTLALLFAFGSLAAQDSAKQNTFAVNGYTELYYSADFNNPVRNAKPGFIYNHNRNNEVTLNLGYIRAAYTTDKIRARLALAAGTYINANYAAEPGVLKNCYEASLGLKLSAKSNLWMDAGILAAHIGFESAEGRDCWTLTRSLLAENSPYFESGAKLGYTTKDDKWYLSAMLLNGWQRITRPAGNTTPAFGWQVTFKPTGRLTLNSSSFAGSEQPDSIRCMRYFHNFYTIIRLDERWGITAGIDYGLQQQSKGSRRFSQWWSPVVLLRFSPNDKNRIAGRMEYYDDKDGVIVATGTPHGFGTGGWSLNYDRVVTGNVLARVEIRQLLGKDDYFERKNNLYSGSDMYITAAIAIGF